jgi:phosphatidylinositol dimannoside acyltransferase
MENYHLYRLGMWLVAHLPVGPVYFVAGFIGELHFLFNRRERRGVYANQRHVLPPDLSAWRRWRSARAIFRHFAYSIADFLRIPLMRPATIGRFMAHVTGYEHLEAALATGKGGIFVTVHMGSWEMAGAYLSLRGLPLTAVALPHKDDRINRIYVESRQNVGMEVVAVGGAMAKLENALRRGRFIALLADRDTTGKGPLLPFLGETAHMPDGHAKLALRTGAWIVPATIYRLRNGQQVIEMLPPIIPDPEHDTPESLTRRCIDYLEASIRAHPEQWFSFYDLWHGTELPVA